MELNEALDKLKENGALVEATVPTITLAEFNSRIGRLDKGWEIGKLNGNRNPSAPWVLSKLGIGMITFSTWVHEDPNGLGLVVNVRGLGAEPDENAKKDIRRIFDNIFNK